ncbi:MAG: hypothetical protein Q7K65_02850 [Candidatus Buchananbacteria bacterium]|nr:hypothetical protein [Candidatus Buchananbacteria bacterium]
MKNFETGVEKIEPRELDAEEKKQLGQVWSQVILGRSVKPEKIEEMSNDELKDWLSSSLMSEIRILADEWGIAPDQKLIEETKEDIEAAEKSKRQMAYIQKCLENINEFAEQDREEKRQRSQHWDSWPETMRENKDFNCVGASMLGADLLDRAEIENYYGNPSGHIMNVVKLADGRLVYADFRNDLVTEINPEEVEVAGIRTLKIDNDLIDYQLIPVVDKNGLAEAALGNLSSLIKEASESDVSNLNPHEKEARRVAQQHQNLIEDVSVYDIYHTVFSDNMSFHSSLEMQAEAERVQLIYDFEDSLKELTAEIINSLGQKESLKLMLDNVDQIEEYLSGAGELSSLPDFLGEIFKKVKEALAELAQKDEKLALRMQSKIIGRIKINNK